MVSSDEVSVCPFNNEHKVLTIRLPAHILKCQKNYRGPQLEVCIYNACHLVQRGQMQEHLETCRERHGFHRCDYERSFRVGESDIGT